MTEETQDFDAMVADIQAEINQPEAAEEEQKAAEPVAEEPQEEEVVSDTPDDEEDEPEDEDTEEDDQPQQNKKRSKVIPRGRFDEVNDQLKREREERAADKLKMQQLEEMLNALATGKDKKAEEDKFDPLDEEAYNRTEKRMKELEQKMELDNFRNTYLAEDRQMAAQRPDWEDVKNDVILADAMYIARHEAAQGNQITEEQAIQAAIAANSRALMNAHKKGQSTSKYILSRHADAARFLGKQQAKVEKASPNASKKANIKGLEELSRKAGAPTNKSAFTDTGAGSFDALWAEVRREAQELTKQGF